MNISQLYRFFHILDILLNLGYSNRMPTRNGKNAERKITQRQILKWRRSVCFVDWLISLLNLKACQAV